MKIYNFILFGLIGMQLTNVHSQDCSRCQKPEHICPLYGETDIEKRFKELEKKFCKLYECSTSKQIDDLCQPSREYTQLRIQLEEKTKKCLLQVNESLKKVFPQLDIDIKNHPSKRRELLKNEEQIKSNPQVKKAIESFEKKIHDMNNIVINSNSMERLRKTATVGLERMCDYHREKLEKELLPTEAQREDIG